MNRLTRIAIIAAMTWLVAAAAVNAQPSSHLGQNVVDHVTLRLSGPSGSAMPNAPQYYCAFVRVEPDGETPGPVSPYWVPRDRRLVITDVEWFSPFTWGPSGDWPPPPKFGAGDTVRLLAYGFTPPNKFSPVFVSRTVEVGAARAGVGSSEQLTAGFVVAPGTMICLLVLSANGDFGYLSPPGEAILRGYYIDGQG